MSTLAKILVVVNALLAAWFLASSANYLGHQDTFRSKYKTEEGNHQETRARLGKQVADANTRAATTDANLRAMTTENNSLKTENARLQTRLDRVSAELDNLMEGHTVLQRAVDRMSTGSTSTQELVKELHGTTAGQREQISSLQSDLNDEKKQHSQTQLSLERALANVQNLESKVASLSEKVREQAAQLAYFAERFPGVVATSQPPHAGQVLSANSSANVVVISLGAEDGVKPGFTYMVSRGSNFVADIQIDDVQAKKSSGFVLRDRSSGDVQVGDRVQNAR